MTPLELFHQHVTTWKGCTACDLHRGRQRVVLARGRIPCDVLFVGEAPGENENLIGQPFVGPAGNLLDQIIARSVPPLVSWAMTNLVCCIPREDDGTGTEKASQPPVDAIEACSVRLQEFVEIANPTLIVCVGSMARDWLDPDWKRGIGFHKAIDMIDIVHPAAILRSNVAQRGMAVQRCIVAIHNAVKEFVLKV